MLIRALILVFILLCSAGVAHAQGETSEEADAATKAVARELGLEGIRLYKAGQHQEALDKLERAHELVGLTTTGLWRARCLVALKRYVEGSEALFQVTRMPLPADAKPVHVEAQREAEAERKELQPRIPRLVIKIVGELPDDTTIMLDGQVMAPALLGVKQPVDPGEHVLEARGAGTSAQKTIALAEGQVLEVPIRLVDRDGKKITPELDARDDEPVLSTVGWVIVAVGGAGLIVGAVTGGLAISQKSDLDAGCVDNACPPPLHASVDDFETMRLVSTISFIAGGVIAATGVALVITGAATGEYSALRVGPGTLRIEGRF